METDSALLDAVRRLNKDALTQVFDEYAPSLYRYALRLCHDSIAADHIVGDVFAKLLEQLALGKGPRTNLHSYLFQSAFHIFVDQVRDGGRWIALEALDPVPAEAQSPGLRCEQNILYEAVSQAVLNELTDYQRHVIFLRFLEGYSLRETAIMLAKSVNVIKQAQSRALANLQAALVEGAVP